MPYIEKIYLQQYFKGENGPKKPTGIYYGKKSSREKDKAQAKIFTDKAAADEQLAILNHDTSRGLFWEMRWRTSTHV